MSPRYVLGFALLTAASLSCSSRRTRPAQEPPPPDLRPTVIAYVDRDGFDQLLETALTNEDPVILIRTDSATADWGARLNAWLAAWNMGGKVTEGKARMQAPVTVNAATIREFRLLTDDLMGRAEKLARTGSAWFGNERLVRHRVELLRPYNLRFHMGPDGTIQIILFNGRYSKYHPDFVRSTARPDDDVPEEWVRGWSCSHCRKTGRGTGE